jgi:hypothetical protein
VAVRGVPGITTGGEKGQHTDMEAESGRCSADQAEVWSPGVSPITPTLVPVAALPPSDGAAPQRTERRRTAKAARRAAGVQGCGMRNVARWTLPVWVLLRICSLGFPASAPHVATLPSQLQVHAWHV